MPTTPPPPPPASSSSPLPPSAPARSHDDEAVRAQIRASETCLSWQRLGDLPPAFLRDEGAFVVPHAPPTPTADAHADALHYVAVFPPPAVGPLRGIVVFLHGINEHSGRFTHVFAALGAMGFGVVAYDLRGHGRSAMAVPGHRAHIPRFRTLVEDTAAFVAHARATLVPAMLQRRAAASDNVEDDDDDDDARPETTTTSLPWLLMGYSLGGLVAVHTVLDEALDVGAFDGLVLVAPAIDVEATWSLRLLRPFLGALAALWPTAPIVPLVNDEWVFRDPLAAADYVADPLATCERATPATSREVLGAMAALARDPRPADPARWPPRTLVLLGEDDHVVSRAAAEGLVARAGGTDKSVVVIPGAYHVLFEDFARAEVLDALRVWLQGRFAALASSSSASC